MSRQTTHDVEDTPTEDAPATLLQAAARFTDHWLGDGDEPEGGEDD
jgi:hypothetical protein